MQERADKHELLSHTVRVRRDELTETPIDAEATGIVGDALATLLYAHPKEVSHVVEVLAPGEEAVDVGIVGHVGNHALTINGIAAHRPATNTDVTLVKSERPHYGADERRLARPVVANEAKDAACPHGQRDAINSPPTTIALGVPVHDEDGLCPTDPPGCRISTITILRCSHRTSCSITNRTTVIG